MLYKSEYNGSCAFYNSFCFCPKNTDTKICKCGEEHEVNWSWDQKHTNSQVILSENNTEVHFHPSYSSGTAAVRGQTPFLPGHHYYWEIKMLSSLYGTDVMVGVGTEKVQLQMSAYRFCSMLGQDEESWGYSYRGLVQHKGKFTNYGPTFDFGTIVGVHLDMCAGTLEFYHNRRPLGVAFTGLALKSLYPMVSSTAARSAIRVICAIDCQLNLQLECIRLIRKNKKLFTQMNEIPGLLAMVHNFWWLIPQSPKTLKKKRKEDSDTESDSDLEGVDDVDRCTRKRKKQWESAHLLDDAALLLQIPTAVNMYEDGVLPVAHWIYDDLDT